MNEISPVNCGYSLNFDGVYICRLECRPCKEPCALDSLQDRMKNMAIAMKRVQNESD